MTRCAPYKWTESPGRGVGSNLGGRKFGQCAGVRNHRSAWKYGAEVPMKAATDVAMDITSCGCGEEAKTASI